MGARQGSAEELLLIPDTEASFLPFFEPSVEQISRSGLNLVMAET